MKITIDVDPLTGFHLTWLGMFMIKGKWLQPDQVVTALVNEEFNKLNSRKQAVQTYSSASFAEPGVALFARAIIMLKLKGLQIDARNRA